MAVRPIIFRAKRKDNGKWLISDSLFQCEYNGGTVELWGTMDFVEVIPETVGQYTGLTDKHGKKIFEGDIVYYYMSPYHERFIVEFFDGAFVVKSKGNHIRSPLYHFCPLVEVIGNVIDNPELLEVEND